MKKNESKHASACDKKVFSVILLYNPFVKCGTFCAAPYRDYIVLDIETTGLSCQRNEILEIAMIKVQNGKPAETFQAFVKPAGPIPPFITRLTGIADQDVCSAAPFPAVWPYVCQFIGDLPVLGWNVKFDLSFLAEKAGRDLPFRYMDVLWLARKALPGLASYRLSAVARHIRVRQGSHRALQDCIACMDIYEAILRSRKVEKNAVHDRMAP